MTELDLLQAIRLKGRTTEADLAATTAGSEAEVRNQVADLAEQGLVITAKMVRISPAGRDKLAALLAEERAGIAGPAMAEAYDEFRAVNGDFKALIADWQLKDGEPNPHDDESYDSSVLRRLDSIHERITPILARVTEQRPRLGRYFDKLEESLAKVHAGETMWLTRPIIDSYHTVWFELHEELIVAAGLTRDDEAKAGHAQ